MQWRSATAFTDELPHLIDLGAMADTVTLTCTNYPSFMRLTTDWRSDTTVEFARDEANGGWFRVWHADSVLSIAVSPNTSARCRQLRVDLGFGNVRDIFIVTQRGR